MSLRKLFRMSVFRAAAMMLTLAPMALHADCLPSVANGWSVHFTMSSHGINHVVSYTTGTLTGSFFFGTAYLTNTNNPQFGQCRRILQAFQCPTSCTPPD